MIALAGVVGSLGLAAAVALLLELIDPVLIGVRQIEKLGERPVVGTVPFVT
jgi:hypothetical protein